MPRPMTEVMSDFRRRIDRVLEPEFVGALDRASVDELRAKLQEVREEEDALSYVRRLLHGRLDMLRAELDMRIGGRGTRRSLEALGHALGGETLSARGSRPRFRARTAEVVGRRGAERVLDEDHLTRLPDLTTEELTDAVEYVAGEERRLSVDRRRLFAVIESLESELAGRYKAGLRPPV